MEGARLPAMIPRKESGLDFFHAHEPRVLAKGTMQLSITAVVPSDENIAVWICYETVLLPA